MQNFSDFLRFAWRATVMEYPDEKNNISYAYAITRKEWEELWKNTLQT